MSQASLILLSPAATADHLTAAMQQAPDGERLLILPPHLHDRSGNEPALKIDRTNPGLRLQLIDGAIAALRPSLLIADLVAAGEVIPTLSRHPGLKSAILLLDGSEKRKLLREQARHFQHSELVRV